MISTERFEAILKAGARWSDWSKHMTEEEIAYIKAGWNKMPGYTCFHDALMRAYHHDAPFGFADDSNVHPIFGAILTSWKKGISQ